jgi:hypothetical protein
MRRFAALAVLLSCPAIAAAQARSSEEAGPQLFGVLAVGWLTDDEGSLGSGLDIGAGVGYRWRGPLAAEAQLERLGTERRFESGVDFDARLFQLSGRLLYHFSAGKTEPYVGGAVGLSRFERTSVFPVLTPGPDGRPVRQGDEVFRRDERVHVGRRRGRESSRGAARSGAARGRGAHHTAEHLRGRVRRREDRRRAMTST